MERKSERVRQMKSNFMDLHEKGYSILEIAEKFNISPSTVYVNLQTIADSNGCSRDSLLTEVHKTPIYWERLEKERVDVQNILEGYDTLLSSIKDLIVKIGYVLDAENTEGGKDYE